MEERLVLKLGGESEGGNSVKGSVCWVGEVVMLLAILLAALADDLKLAKTELRCSPMVLLSNGRLVHSFVPLDFRLHQVQGAEGESNSKLGRPCRKPSASMSEQIIKSVAVHG